MEKSSQQSASFMAYEVMGGIFNTHVIAALVQSNVIETIGLQAKTLDELAATCKLNKNVLARTLRYASYLKMVSISEAMYSLTEAGKYFLQDTPGSLAGSMQFLYAPPWRDSWNSFPYCLQTGEAAFNHVFGLPFFEYLDKNEMYGKPFNHYMSQMTAMVASLVSNTYDFSSFKTICDVGGGHGILLKAVLEKFIHCNGILFDYKNTLDKHELGATVSRVQLLPGNFFDTIPHADCMILKTVIHDWNDNNSIRILTNCRKSLNQEGKIILIEQVIEEPFTPMALFYDLHMQVMLGGAERTVSEFTALFNASGLKLERIITTPSPLRLLELSAN